MMDDAPYLLTGDADALNAAAYERAVLCTLVSVEGGFSRSVGAQLAVRGHGTSPRR